jgi:hypothetical protein
LTLLQKISDSARGEFEEGSEKQMREALQSIHVAAEQALTELNTHAEEHKEDV